MTPFLYKWHGTGNIPPRAGRRHIGIVPYGVYACADGEVNLAVQNDREWRRFCQHVLQTPDVAVDSRFATNQLRLQHRQELESLIERCFGKLAKSDLLDRLEAAAIATGALNGVADLMRHPQLAARNRWLTLDSPAGPIPAMLAPHNLLHVPPCAGPVPALGEHTAAILKELEQLP
jgi:itaconate CoA-transferase